MHRVLKRAASKVRIEKQVTVQHIQEGSDIHAACACAPTGAKISSGCAATSMRW